MKYARDFITSTLVGGLFVRERVHILDIPFTQAIKSVSRWGSGSKDLVAAMRKQVTGRTEGETSSRGSLSRSTIESQGA